MKRFCQNCIWMSVMLCLLLAGCAAKSPPPQKKAGPPRDAAPVVLIPEASGTVVYAAEAAWIDASNAGEGYIMVSYNGDNQKVKLQITTPDQVSYTYLLGKRNSAETFPLTAESGTYQITLYENISGDQYAAILSQRMEVALTDEFKPFLYPNQYVNFSPDSQVVAKGAELAADTYSDLEVVTNIYNYVIKTISYDKELADNVSYGYLPDPDQTLKKKKGICFDYAAVMASMLRSQRIPTKLVVGYSGEAYHAWISTYVDDIGWVDNVIEFDGTSWSLMDPTLAAGKNSKNVKKYVGDGSNYLVKYTY